MPLAQAFDERKALLLYGKDALLDGGTIGVLSLFDHRDCIVRIADLGLARCIVWNLLAAELIGAGTLAVSLEVCSWGDVGPLDVGALVQLSQRLRDIGYQRLILVTSGLKVFGKSGLSASYLVSAPST